MKVIVTRPEPDGSAFAADLVRAGHTAILSPAMEILVSGAACDLSGVGALAFTSANGVRALAASVSLMDVDLPVFTVGPATAAAARAAGFRSVVAAEGDVESLARLIGAAADRASFSGPVMHIAGADRAGDLAAMLAARNVPARRAVLYLASPACRLTPEAAAALSDYSSRVAVALFSPRTARLFIDLAQGARVIDHLRRAIALCLSPAVADTAAVATWFEVRVASEFSAEGMISELQRSEQP